MLFQFEGDGTVLRSGILIADYFCSGDLQMVLTHRPTFNSSNLFRRLSLPYESCSQLNLISYTTKDYLTNKDAIAGLGVDISENLAFTKAIAEYYERKEFYKNIEKYNLETTNGMAAHIFTSLAIKKAKAEIVERDSLFRHWYTKTPFKKISSDSSWIQSVADELSIKGFSLLLGETYLGVEKTIVCFLVEEKTQGFVVGCESNGDDAFKKEKAVQEALINLSFGDQNDNFDQATARINNYGINTLKDHRAYWRYLKPLPKWVFNTNLDSEQSLNEHEVIYDVNVLKRFPMSVVAVESPSLIPFVVGEWNLANNFKYKLRVNDGEVIHPIP